MYWVIGAFGALTIFGMSFLALDYLGGRSSFERGRLRLRMERLNPVPAAPIEKGVHFSDIKLLNRILTGQSYARKLNHLLKMTDWRISTSLFILSSVLGAALLFILVRWRGLPLVYSGMVSGLALFFIPMMLLRAKRSKYLKKFDIHFPRALQVIRGSLDAGVGLMTAFESAAKDSPYPVNTEFTFLNEEMALGQNLVDTLTDFQKRIPTQDAKTFSIGISVQQESGGNLVELMGNLEETISARAGLRREMNALTAQARLSGWIIGCLPLVLAGVLWRLNPDYMSVLFDTELGQMILLVVIVMQLIGFACIKKLVSVKIMT